MKRKLIMALVVAVSFLLQCTVCQTIAMASISPNLMMIVTSCFGFMRGEKEGLVVGFFSGLLLDIFFGRVFGFYALIYMFIGYGNGMFHMMFYDEDIKLPMIWVALSELVYGLIVYFFMFLLRSEFEFGFYFARIILPELIYTVVLTLVLYRLIRRLNRRLEAMEADTSTAVPYLLKENSSINDNTEEY